MSLILTSRKGALLHITLNRPDRLNALFGNMRELLLEALELAASDDGIRAVVITGAGRAFCAGGDINYMAELQQNGDVEGFRALLEAGRRIILRLRSLTKPVVAAINGVAAGAGLNLALACDIRIAAETARFSQAFAKIGLHPDWGGTFFLPRLIGTSAACRMIFTADSIDALEALRLGLIDEVHPVERLQEAVDSLVEKLIAAPPLAIALAKESIYAGMESSLQAALYREEQAQIECFQSADAKEGISAFREQRSPVFTGGRIHTGGISPNTIIKPQ